VNKRWGMEVAEQVKEAYCICSCGNNLTINLRFDSNGDVIAFTTFGEKITEPTAKVRRYMYKNHRKRRYGMNVNMNNIFLFCVDCNKKHQLKTFTL
jgi:hypothetical protein